MEDTVLYGHALVLKELGFDRPTEFYFTKEDAPKSMVWRKRAEVLNHNGDAGLPPKVSAPTLYEAAKWLREVKNWSVRVNYSRENREWFYDILNMETGDYDDGGDCYFQSYEEAFSAGVSAILSKLTTN